LKKKLIYAGYDLGNSAYSAIIITFITSTYFANAVVGNPQLGQAYLQWTLALSGFVVAILSLFLGIVADRLKSGKILMLRVFTLGCIISTIFFWFIKPEKDYIFFSLLIFFISNVCYEIGVLFYDSLLKQSSENKNLGKTSGFAYGLGYFGTVPILFIILYIFIVPEIPPFGLKKELAEHIRFVPLVVCIWFLVFSFPLLINLGKITQVKIKSKISGLKRIKNLIWKKELTSTGRFLIARLFYNDALTVLIGGGGVYAAGVFLYDFSGLLELAVYANLAAFLGAVFFGFLNDKYSSSIFIIISIIILLITVVWGSIAKSKTEFLFVVITLGLMLGPIQSASRVMMSKLISTEDLGKGFALYAMTGKITAFIGPLLVGTVTYFTSQRIGFFSVSVLLLLGLFFIYPLRNLKK